jgi:hypothetical protein
LQPVAPKTGNGLIWQLSHERMKREDDDGDSTDPFIVPLNGMAVDLIKSAQGRDNRRVLGAALIKAEANTRTMRVNQPAALMRAICAPWQRRWNASFTASWALPCRRRRRRSDHPWRRDQARSAHCWPGFLSARSQRASGIHQYGFLVQGSNFAGRGRCASMNRLPRK